jgi:uncharacterized protein with FMN-binding domain
MKTRSTAARLVPAMMVAAATAIPAVTAVDLLTHAPATTSLVALGTSASGTSTLAGSAGSSGTTAPPAASGSSATATPQATAASGSTSRTYVGAAEENRYGTVQATLVVTGSKITNVIITAPQDNPRSAYINSYAVPILVSETLQAQSANIDAVSGATYTSESYIGSLQAALAEAHL